MTDLYRESKGHRGRREELRDDLRKKADWHDIEEYARLRADQLVVQTLSSLHRRIGAWAESTYTTNADPADVVRDVVQVLADTLTDAGAAVVEVQR